MLARSGRLLAGLLVLGGVLAPETTASASSVDSTTIATIQVGDLVLDPGARGYTGTLPVTVKYTSREPGYLDLTITEPVAGAWQSMANGEGCVWGTVTEGRRTISCYIGSFTQGESRDVSSVFRVLTTPQPYAMSAVTVDIAATRVDQPVGKVKQYTTKFRSTKGSLRNPRPYVQDTQSDASISTAGAVTMVRQADGYYLGHLPMKATWNGDAAHWLLNIDAALPDGWIVWDTDPQSGYPCAGGCSVPGPNGPQLMQGETVGFDLVIYAPEGTPAGTYRPLTARAAASWTDGELTDVTPFDNTATFIATVS